MYAKPLRPAPAVSVAIALLLTASATGTALDDYVARADDSYAFVQVGTPSLDEATQTVGHILDLTSQTWRDTSEVDHATWRHWVTVIVPRDILFLPPTKDTALLLIDGGDYDDAAPSIDPSLRQLAAGIRMVTVVLSAVPNQPLWFADESTSRREDEIIAYSWDKFLRTGDAEWPAQLPMVKSVVRCMDAVTTFVASGAGGGKPIRGFFLTGGSKRGWTAWLTAAVDTRVRAIAPIVSNLLNMRVSFAHHLASYGYWADVVAPYEDLGIFDWLQSAEGAALLEIVDPFEYRDRFTMPKFIINATGDDFFVLDSVKFYLHDLPGETYLRHVPNTDHYLTGAYENIVGSLAPYADALLNGRPRPRFDWTLEADGSIVVETIDRPLAVNLWQADNAGARDFRLTSIGPAWSSSPLQDQGGGVYIAPISTPAAGWTAFFVELVYNNPFAAEFSSYGDYKYRFTTEIRVLPAALPFHEALLAPLHRFWSPITGKHFLTLDEGEKRKLLTVYPDQWQYEGIAYQAYLAEADWGQAPVHRFWSDALGAHFYTISDAERLKLIDNYSHVWTYEGIAFHAYQPGQQPLGGLPVHRFWSDKHGSHFYTTSEAEKNKLITDYAYAWTYEGVAWYAGVGIR